MGVLNGTGVIINSQMAYLTVGMMLGILFPTLIFGSVFAYAIVLVIPFLSVFVFLGALLTKGYNFVAPLLLTQVSGGMIYCMALFLVLLFSIITGWGQEYEGPEGKVVRSPQRIVKQDTKSGSI
ncbi:hypothetical protein [Neobacillus drentensis]|uniref:hypothetical protein n=1 Tax=Neobacillus drentensis TaxID=220684 RepID=UPI003001241A